jgi:hypothetical protein
MYISYLQMRKVVTTPSVLQCNYLLSSALCTLCNPLRINFELIYICLSILCWANPEYLFPLLFVSFVPCWASVAHVVTKLWGRRRKSGSVAESGKIFFCPPKCLRSSIGYNHPPVSVGNMGFSQK